MAHKNQLLALTEEQLSKTDKSQGCKAFLRGMKGMYIGVDVPGQILPSDQTHNSVVIVHHHQVTKSQGTELLIQLEHEDRSYHCSLLVHLMTETHLWEGGGVDYR